MYAILRSAAVVAQTRSFVSLAQNVTKISDPVNASIAASKLIVDVCLPPQFKYPVKCTILALQLLLSFQAGGLASVTCVALSIGSAKQVLEELQ